MSHIIELRIPKQDLGKAVDLLVEDAAVQMLSVNPHPAIRVIDPASAFERSLVITLKPDEPGVGIPLQDAPGHEPDEAFAALLRKHGVTVNHHRIVGGTRGPRPSMGGGHG